MSKKIELTKEELITIIEDAFIDGWKKGQLREWYDPEEFLEHHKEYNDSSETTIALDDLRAELEQENDNVN